ncbi:MAG: glycosyltransferase [Thermoactinospora sp.]|nr:glycosyltransferase [Thermoactinospora sp.]
MSVTFACIDADTLGGIQQITHTLAQGLAERGYDVQVIGLQRTEAPFRYVAHPLYARHLVAKDSNLPKILPSDGFLVMTSPGVVTRLAGYGTGLRRIGQYHGSYEHARGTWHLGSIRRHYGQLDQAVFLSEADAWQFAEHTLLPNTWAMPNPLREWPSRVSTLVTPRVLGVGRLAGVKRFDRLITAFARASAPPWELHLIGDGPEEERLRAHARSEGVEDRVIFRGRVDAADMPREYDDAALLGLSSEHEGLPLVLLEAAAHGVPAVAFDVSGGVRSIAPVLVPPGDVDGFAVRLGALMASYDERRRLGAAVRSQAAGFRLDRVLDRWEVLFSHITR